MTMFANFTEPITSIFTICLRTRREVLHGFYMVHRVDISFAQVLEWAPVPSSSSSSSTSSAVVIFSPRWQRLSIDTLSARVHFHGTSSCPWYLQLFDSPEGPPLCGPFFPAPSVVLPSPLAYPLLPSPPFSPLPVPFLVRCHSRGPTPSARTSLSVLLALARSCWSCMAPPSRSSARCSHRFICSLTSIGQISKRETSSTSLEHLTYSAGFGYMHSRRTLNIIHHVLLFFCVESCQPSAPSISSRSSTFQSSCTSPTH